MLLESDSWTRCSPWFWDLIVWNGGPRGLAVPLLFEFATEGLFYVVHVESADRRAGDAVEGATVEDKCYKEQDKGQNQHLSKSGTTF